MRRVVFWVEQPKAPLGARILSDSEASEAREGSRGTFAREPVVW
jgi:hypothetical protein